MAASGTNEKRNMQVSDDVFDKDTNAIAVRVLEEDDIYLRNYVNEGIRQLAHIASSNGLKPTELRICFASRWMSG